MPGVPNPGSPWVLLTGGLTLGPCSQAASLQARDTLLRLSSSVLSTKAVVSRATGAKELLTLKPPQESSPIPAFLCFLPSLSVRLFPSRSPHMESLETAKPQASVTEVFTQHGPHGHTGLETHRLCKHWDEARQSNSPEVPAVLLLCEPHRATRDGGTRGGCRPNSCP